MSRRGRPLILILVVLALLTVIDATRNHVLPINNPIAPGLNDTPRAIVVPFSGSGYSTRATVTEVSAKWRVPTISRRSPVGQASSWIGAQGPQNAFIQLGTVENKFTPTGLGQYEAFWSDPTQGLHPVILLVVRPGDLVEAEMIRSASGWQMHFADITTSQSVPGFTAYSNSLAFDTAKWMQGDPIDHPGTEYGAPYPDLSTVRFQQLRVNGSAPDPRLVQSATLSTRGGTSFIPTPIAGDQFTLRPATGPAQQYLNDVYQFNIVENKFDTVVNARLTPSARVTQLLTAAYQACDHLLSAQPWPVNVQTYVSRNVRLDSHLVSLLRAWSAAPSNLTSARLNTYLRATLSSLTVVDDLRLRVGVSSI